MFLVNISECDNEHLVFLYRSSDGKSKEVIKRIRIFSELLCSPTQKINEDLFDILYFPVHHFYGNKKIIVERQYFNNIQTWKELKRAPDATSRSFVNFSPSHATMIQESIRIGDSENEGESGLDYVPMIDLSFDIETTSLDPTEEGALTLTICAQVSLILADRIQPLKRYVFQLGVFDPHHPLLEEHRKDGVELILREFSCAPDSFATCLVAEREMLLAWVKLIQEVDPDTITGHNIQRFDIPFLYERASIASKSKSLKRKSSNEPHILDWGRGINKRLFKQTNGFRVSGRIFIDTYDVAREKMGVKIPGETKLNKLSKRFLDSEKEEMHYSEIIPCFKGTPQTRARLASYCLQDAILPAELSQNWVVHIGLFAEARMTFSPFGCPTMLAITGTYNYFGLYGGMEEKDRQNWTRVWIPYVIESPISHHDYVGGHVFDMIPGFYEQYVATLDFQSLYPMTMIAHNLCARSLVPLEDLKTMEENEIERRCEKIWCDVPNQENVQRLHVFWKASEVEGLTPRILRIFLEMREYHKMKKGEAKKAGNKALFLSYDAQQLADKLVCNKTYGLFATNAGTQREDDQKVYHGHLPCVPVAEATCAWGRTHIKRVAEYVTTPESLSIRENVNIRLIGGDTDSVIIHVMMGEKNPEKIIRICQNLCREINRELPRPENLEFETVHETFLYYKKKNYAAISETVENGVLVRKDAPDDVKIRGFGCLKSDSIPFVAEAQFHLLRCILRVPFALPQTRTPLLPKSLFVLEDTSIYFDFDRIMLNVIEHLTTRKIDPKAIVKNIKISKDIETTQGPQYDVARDMLKKHAQGKLPVGTAPPQKYDSIPFIWSMKNKKKTAVHINEIENHPIYVEHYLDSLKSALEIFTPYKPNVLRLFEDTCIRAKRVFNPPKNFFANNNLIQKKQ